MKRNYFCAVFAAFSVFTLFGLATNTALAQEQAEGNTTPIVITPNRFPTALDETGSSVSVIDSGEIEAKRQFTVLDLLRTVAGVEVNQIGGPGRTASVFIRGADSDHTLVLIDGVRVNDNSTGQFDFSTLKAENIERIEVLRGPQSVLYGSEAIGGVINIITKRAEDGVSGGVTVEGGSHETQNYQGRLGWGSEFFNTSNTVSFLKTEGISAAESNRGNPEDDSYENFTVSSGNGVTFLEDGRADITMRYASTETELDGFEFGVGAVDDPNFVQETDLFTTGVAISKPVTEWFIPNVELGYTQQDLEGTDPDTEFNNFEIDNDTLSVDAKLDFLPTEESVVSLGYAYEDRQGDNKGNFDESRNVNSFFVNAQYAVLEKLFLTAGVRHDDDSDFGDETTYRVTAAYLHDDSGTRLHGSYGTAFKAPSFNELFFPNFGNPDLDAETSWGYDIGVEQAFAERKVVLDVTYFQSEIEDLITFDTNTFLAENIEEAEVLGIESRLALDLISWAKTDLTYTYTDSENKTAGGILPRRPRHRGTANVFLTPVEDLEATVTFILVNRRRDSDGAEMDNYERFDLTVAYTIAEHITPFVKFENLFDEDYEEVPGYGTPGFSVFGGIEAAL